MAEISKAFLLQLYTMMVKIRLCEESLVQPIMDGQIRCPCHLYSGEEAIAVGVCAALEPKDVIYGIIDPTEYKGSGIYYLLL